MGVGGDLGEEWIAFMVVRCSRIESILDDSEDCVWDKLACVWVNVVWLWVR